MRIRVINGQLLASCIMFILAGFCAGMTTMAGLMGSVEVGFGSATGVLLGLGCVFAFIWWSEVSRVFGAYAINGTVARFPNDPQTGRVVEFVNTDESDPDLTWDGPLATVAAPLHRVHPAIESAARQISG